MSNSGRRRWLAGIIVSLLLACARLPDAAPGTLTVSAAADLMPALQEVGQRFTQETGIQLRFNFGSTGQLAQQIERGAPVDLFLAANRAAIEELERQGLVVPGTKALYARGRLALWTRADSPLALERLEELARPEVRRIALAHPDHAPYGVAAREALQAVGLWEALQPKLVLGENVRQALLYAERGDVDVALVALSLSLASAGRWVLVPEGLHQPLDQALAVIKGTRHESEARQFAAYLRGPQGRPIMQKYGFVLPEEAGP
ncbi:MAG TPA: molybdate ABC transporter substrate-binding protein [Chloroflexota bacterium]|jgi:molybdate transport system substrate-binding protein|nr:molybdate ABC transporter substrate-binding protein [Chloroflexota bacterium]